MLHQCGLTVTPNECSCYHRRGPSGRGGRPARAALGAPDVQGADLGDGLEADGPAVGQGQGPLRAQRDGAFLRARLWVCSGGRAEHDRVGEPPNQNTNDDRDEFECYEWTRVSESKAVETTLGCLSRRNNPPPTPSFGDNLPTIDSLPTSLTAYVIKPKHTRP